MVPVIVPPPCRMTPATVLVKVAMSSVPPLTFTLLAVGMTSPAPRASVPALMLTPPV